MIEGGRQSETTRERVTAMALLRTPLGVRLATGMAVRDDRGPGEGLPTRTQSHTSLKDGYRERSE